MKNTKLIVSLFFCANVFASFAIDQDASIAINIPDTTRAPKKTWTVLIYAAADNNLRDFASQNIKQSSSVGSTNDLNILFHLDIRLIGNRKTTRRYYIEKNHVVQVNSADEHKPPMDSGDPQTLISAAQWAIEQYPAEHYALILWNHGTGIIDPISGRLLKTENLYCYNAKTDTFDLDRTFGFLDLIEIMNIDPRGICWDDTTGNYLTNQKLEAALATICNNFLGGKKFDIIGFDACLMSMLEVAEIIKKFAHYQVSSQEVEPGRGWPYNLVFSPFANGVPDAQSFACNIVQSYASTYHRRTRDFTLSALDLSLIGALENNVSQVAHLLLQAMTLDAVAVKNLVRMSKSNSHCTHFDEPSYKDLHHLYNNLIDHLRSLNSSKVPASMIHEIIHLIENGKNLIRRIVLANTTGSNLSKAQGISIYFPERRIHPSYKKTNFAQNNHWSELILQILIG